MWVNTKRSSDDEKKIPLIALPFILSAGQVMAATSEEGYYASAKYVYSEQHASDQDSSSRPGVGQFVNGKEKDRLSSASLAAGYQYGNGWRTEGEYTFRQKTEFTSGSTFFPTGTPARRTLGVSWLPENMLVQIDAVVSHAEGTAPDKA